MTSQGFLLNTRRRRKGEPFATTDRIPASTPRQPTGQRRRVARMAELQRLARARMAGGAIVGGNLSHHRTQHRD